MSYLCFDALKSWVQYTTHYIASNYYTAPSSDLQFKFDKAVSLVLATVLPALAPTGTTLSDLSNNIFLLFTAYNGNLQTYFHANILAAGWTGSGGNFTANNSSGTTARTAVKNASSAFVVTYFESLPYQSYPITAGQLAGVLDRYFLSRIYETVVSGVPEPRNMADSQPIFQSFENYSDWDSQL